MSDTTALPSLVDDAAVRDPFKAYDAIRAQAPVYRSPELGVVMVTAYEDVIDVIKDTDTFSSRWIRKAREGFSPQASVAAVLAKGFPQEGEVLTWADGASHGHHASILKPFLTRSAVRALAPTVEQIAVELVAALPAEGETDIVARLSVPMAIRAMCAFVGVPGDEAELFSRAADAEVALQGSIMSEEEAIAAAETFVQLQLYLADQIRAREAEPTDDLISAVANDTPPDGLEPLTMAEKVSLVKLAVVAGNETTRGHISACVLKLAEEPDLVDRVRADEEALDALLEEVLRAEPPVLLLFRIATRDVVLRGVPIAAGELVAICFGSANYDDAVFQEPHEFDIERENVRRHLAFGFGLHYCMGAPIARLETKTAIRTLLDRYERFELVEGGRHYHPHFLTHNLEALHVRLVPRR